MRQQQRRLGECIFCAFGAQQRHRLPSFVLSSSHKSSSFARDGVSSFGLLSFGAAAMRSRSGNRTKGNFRNAPKYPRRGDESNKKAKKNGVRTSAEQILQKVKALEYSPQVRGRLRTQNHTQEALKTQLEAFKRSILTGSMKSRQEDPLQPTLGSLERLLILDGPDALDETLQLGLAACVISSTFNLIDIRNQNAAADMRHPMEWFPAARTLQRKIHLHVGPTNSGKTYQALKRLEAAESGIYAGPLRLLAHEVYSRLNAAGRPCTLVTGDERKTPDGGLTDTKLLSCTVEMVPLNTLVDVAVIDEIQMMANDSRGWAWTSALLGLMAKEIHLCGEERTVPLIRKLVAAMGDELEVHTYKRLSPLGVMPSLNQNLAKLQTGDCVVVFSRLGLYAMKAAIERKTGKRCAIVYGGLPADTRAEQAKLFNDPDSGYDFLVATDAIGMGLNLSVKRIIFESIERSGGRGITKTLPISDIKQIGGRAGRYRVAPRIDDSTVAKPVLSADAGQSPSSGWVTTLDPHDLPVVRHAMNTNAPPITTAGLHPPAAITSRFSQYFPPGTPFSIILLKLDQAAKLHPLFHMSTDSERTTVANLIQSFDGLTVQDRLTLCGAPCHLRDAGFARVLRAFARCIARSSGGNLLDMSDIDLDALDIQEASHIKYLRRLEGLHGQLILYLWLSYRYSGIFRDREMAFHARSLTEKKISETLVAMSKDERVREKLHKRKQDAIIARLKNDLLNKGRQESDGEGATDHANDEVRNDSDLETIPGEFPSSLEKSALDSLSSSPSSSSSSPPIIVDETSLQNISGGHDHPSF